MTVDRSPLDAFFAQDGIAVLPAIHGGITGAFIETTAILGVTREVGASTEPKPIGLTIYLRSSRTLDADEIADDGRRLGGRRMIAVTVARRRLSKLDERSPSEVDYDRKALKKLQVRLRYAPRGHNEQNTELRARGGVRTGQIATLNRLLLAIAAVFSMICEWIRAGLA